MPTGFQWLLLYFVWVIILSDVALFTLHLNNGLLNIVVKGLLQFSMLIGTAFGLLVIISMVYVAKDSQNTKSDAVGNHNKQENIGYPITHINRCSRIAYRLADVEYSQEGKGETGKPQNNAYNESPPSKLGGISSANSRTFVTRIRFAAPKGVACRPTPRFIPAARCRVFSLDFYK